MIYGHVVACTGWTLGEIDRMTLPRWQEIERYYRQHPPLHILAAGYLGYEAEESDPVWDEMVASLDDLARLPPPPP